MALSVGYTNASWTLKCELISRYVTRLLRHMDKTGREVVVPRQRDKTIEPRPLLDLSANYVRRAHDIIPIQGSRLPWRLYQNYILDRWMLGRPNPVDDALELR